MFFLVRDCQNDSVLSGEVGRVGSTNERYPYGTKIENERADFGGE